MILHTVPFLAFNTFLPLKFVIFSLLLLLLLLLLFRFIAFAQTVLNAKIFLLGKLELIAQEQQMLSPYISKTFLSILAVPNKTNFCTIPRLKPLKPLLMHPRAPTTTGTTSLSFFLISFSSTLPSPGIATLMMMHDFAFLSTKIRLGFLTSITSHWIFISQINLTSPSSTTPSGQCSYHLSFLSRLCLLHNFQWTNFATVSCLL